MRALFSYNPSLDTLMPCKEIGLGFETGDILQIVDQSDPNWWQAKKVCLVCFLSTKTYSMMVMSLMKSCDDYLLNLYLQKNYGDFHIVLKTTAIHAFLSLVCRLVKI
jgi:hypothetical protein